MNQQVLGGIEAQETRRLGLPPKKQIQMTVNLGDQRLLDALRAEARDKRMTLNSLMRAMIKGYLGALR